MCSPSAKAFHFSIFGGLEQANFLAYERGGEQAPGFSSRPRWKLLGGAALELGLAPGVGIEIGGTYLEREVEYSYESDEGLLTTHLFSQWVQIPLLLRVWVLELVTLGAGVYYAYPSGNAKVVDDGGTTLSVPPADANLGNQDIGLMAAFGFHVPIAFLLKVFTEFRMDQSIVNVGEKGVYSKFKDTQFLLGLRIGRI